MLKFYRLFNGEELTNDEVKEMNLSAEKESDGRYSCYITEDGIDYAMGDRFIAKEV